MVDCPCENIETYASCSEQVDAAPLITSASSRRLVTADAVIEDVDMCPASIEAHDASTVPSVSSRRLVTADSITQDLGTDATSHEQPLCQLLTHGSANSGTFYQFYPLLLRVKFSVL